jgi:hypothetical protein
MYFVKLLRLPSAFLVNFGEAYVKLRKNRKEYKKRCWLEDEKQNLERQDVLAAMWCGCWHQG